MNVTYCKGTPEDEQAIVDFADFIFSKSYCPHDFRSHFQICMEKENLRRNIIIL